MRWSDISFKLTDRSLRQFAGLWLVFVGALALWQWLGHQRPVAGAVLGALAGSVGAAGLIWPRAAWPFYAGLTVVTFPIGWVVSRALIGVLFFGIFTPLGILFHLIGRDALRVKRSRDGSTPGRNTATYWIPKATPTDVRSYFRMS